MSSENSKKSKKLLVVESPAKAKTIKKILGKDFTVLASVGHIRDLSSSGRGKKAFGIDIDNNYEPKYTIIKGKEKTVKELKEAAGKADEIFLAPDPDREGEAIAWHLKEVMALDDARAQRVTYSAITAKAVKEAIKHPRSIDYNLVDAQKSRRVLDRLVGFSLSPFLWKKIAKNLSAGRVQSVAVKIVVDREKEIQVFIPEEFWKIQADVFKKGAKKKKFYASLTKWDGEKFALGNPLACQEESVRKIESVLKEAEYKVLSIEKKEAKSRPLPPYITSTLQQAASTRLRFGTSKTMSVAQRLYEGIEIDGVPTGLITYMRTDSTRIAPEALDEARDYISKTYSAEYLPGKVNVFSTSKNAQDAHEAIRPTDVSLTPEILSSILSAEQLKLYDLIWKRFIASQMNPAIFNVTTITLEADKGLFTAKGRITVFPGYTILEQEEQKGKKEDSRYQDLPDLEEGQILNLNELTAEQNFTRPPARYSEASLVKALEKEGIGRPSTYAPIIKTIRDRGYVRLEKRYFYATELGTAVTGMLEKYFENVMDLKFTAGMESDLDLVEQGSKNWVSLVDEFYKPFTARVDEAIEVAEPLKNRPYEGEEKCPQCGGNLLIRYSKNGAFLGCENYPECKGLLSMPGENDEEDDASVPDVDCPTCGKPMILKTSRFGKKFLACSGYPDCKTTMSLDKEGKPIELPKIERTCDKCGKPMEVKTGRRGPFLACSNYPECKNTMPIDKDGKVIELPKVENEICEKCGSEMVVKMGRRGPFLACSGYPKCKNAKPLPGNEDKAKEKSEKEDKKEKS